MIFILIKQQYKFLHVLTPEVEFNDSQKRSALVRARHELRVKRSPQGV
jgi:hypothetical protein